MKASDLRARTTEHLQELEKSLAGDSFQARFKNFTNRLNDTAAIKKARRDLARVKTILTQREHAGQSQAQVAGTAGSSEGEGTK